MNRTARLSLAALALASILGGASCSSSEEKQQQQQQQQPPPESKPPVEGQPVSALPGHEALLDSSHKEGPRLIPPEVYLRSYLGFFGEDLTPLEVEELARGTTSGAVFDRWSDYLGALGFPDYKLDVTRAKNTNALMLASFERLGIALCARAVERELGATAPPIAQRRVFAFDLTQSPPTDAEFLERFDVLHRTFLGYPAALAETDRTNRFRTLYNTTVANHPTTGTPKFTPAQAGWAAVCYGLTRHPEFHVY